MIPIPKLGAENQIMSFWLPDLTLPFYETIPVQPTLGYCYIEFRCIINGTAYSNLRTGLSHK